MKRQRHITGIGIEDKLSHRKPIHPLTYQLIDILEEKKHHQDEQHDHEGSRKRPQIGLNNKEMKCFHWILMNALISAAKIEFNGGNQKDQAPRTRISVST